MIAAKLLRPPVLLIASIALAAAIDLAAGAYWITHYPVLTQLDTLPARFFAGLAPADHGFYDRAGQFQIGLVTTNLVIGGALYAALLLAWLRGWRAALPLALATASVQVYAVLIGLWCGLLDGLPNLDRSFAAARLLFYITAGWVGLHGLLGWDALRRFARLSSPTPAALRLDGRDRAVLALTLFFIVTALAVELPWLLASAELGRIGGWFDGFWAIYAAADRGYYDLASGFERGIESFHILFTQWLHLALLWAILTHWQGRYPLQLVVGSYVCFSTACYLLAKHMTGYPLMPDHTAAAFLLLYGANLPWLIGNGWLAYDAARGMRALLPAMQR